MGVQSWRSKPGARKKTHTSSREPAEPEKRHTLLPASQAIHMKSVRTDIQSHCSSREVIKFGKIGQSGIRSAMPERVKSVLSAYLGAIWPRNHIHHRV